MLIEYPISTVRIDRALHRLAGHLVTEGLDMEVALCFGRLFVTVYHAPGSARGSRRIVVPAQKALDLARQVAAEMRLPRTWLSDDVRWFLAYFAATNRTDYDLYSPGISLSVHEPRHLLALKLYACAEDARPDAADDIRFLVQRMKLRSPAEVENLYQSFFPRERLSRTMTSLVAALYPSTANA